MCLCLLFGEKLHSDRFCWTWSGQKYALTQTFWLQPFSFSLIILFLSKVSQPSLTKKRGWSSLLRSPVPWWIPWLRFGEAFVTWCCIKPIFCFSRHNMWYTQHDLPRNRLDSLRRRTQMKSITLLGIPNNRQNQRSSAFPLPFIQPVHVFIRESFGV